MNRKENVEKNIKYRLSKIQNFTDEYSIEGIGITRSVADKK